MQDAFNLLHDAQQNNNDFYFYGEIVAILNSSGRAEWVFFYDKTNMKSGNNPGYGTSNIVGNITSGNIIDYTIAEGNDEPTIDEVLNDIVKKFGWTWDSSVDSIDRLSNGNYSIVYSGRNYTVRMSNNNAPEAPEAGTAVGAGVDKNQDSKLTGTNDNSNGAEIKKLPNGAYSFSDKIGKDTIAKGDIHGKLSKNIFFVFTTTVDDATAKLTIKDEKGREVYQETVTFTKGSNAGNHYFYVQVVGDEPLVNAGWGDLKTNALTKGNYTWEVTGNSVLNTANGTFTIN